MAAAYSSSNPAIGVGPGNAPVYVDETADLDGAARLIVESKSFDNSVLCTNESVLITLDTVEARLRKALSRAGIASRRERSLFENIQQLREQTIDLSKQTLELDRLQREYNQNKAFLEDMLARSNEADIAGGAVWIML